MTGVGTEDSFPLSSIFNLTDRLQIFSYLVTSNRVRWYRVIMRLFLHTHRELYRYQLTAHEIRDTIRDAFDPLFAALGALYRTAAPGVPRLLALDEAFDKVSIANTQRIMEFLVSQDFQWIMTGPQVSGTSAKIPASARYLMLHEKGSPFATVAASFWSDSQDMQSGQK